MRGDNDMTQDRKQAIQITQSAIREWRRAQFPDATLEGAAAHLSRELDEAAEELADVFFLASQCEDLGGVPMGLPERAWDMIQRLGRCPPDVIFAKLAKNMGRKWPARPDKDGIYEASEAENQE